MPDNPLHKLTAHEATMARHALGLDRERIAYRNRYVVTVGTDDFHTWCGMVRHGLAEGGPDDCGTLAGFQLTEIGAKAALREGERLSPEDVIHA